MFNIYFTSVKKIIPVSSDSNFQHFGVLVASGDKYKNVKISIATTTGASQ